MADAIPEIPILHIDKTKVEREWLVYTEKLRRKLVAAKLDGKNDQVVERIASLVTLPPDEDLTQQLIDVAENTQTPERVSATKFSEVTSLKELAAIKKIPEQYYDRTKGLQKGESLLRDDYRDLILQRSRYARDVKMLALQADLLTTDRNDFKNQTDITTNHGVKIRINPAFAQTAQQLLDSSTWQWKRQVKDRVNFVKIGDKEYVLKEQKTLRHEDTTGSDDGKLTTGSSRKEFDMTKMISESGTAKYGDTAVSWERPIAYIQFPDSEGFEMCLFEKIENAFETTDYSEAKNTKHNLNTVSHAMINKILSNRTSYEQEFNKAIHAAAEFYPSITYWDSEKYPSLIDQYHALALNPDPDSIQVGDFTMDEYASVLAVRQILQAEDLLRLELHKRGYKNTDHDGKGEYLFQISDHDQRAELGIVGIDMEYADVLENESDRKRKFSYIRKLIDTDQKDINTSGLTNNEIKRLRYMGIEPDKRLRALGKAIGPLYTLNLNPEVKYDALPDDEAVAKLTEFRKSNEYSETGIWKEKRLVTAVNGIRRYIDIYNHASEDLKSYLRNIQIVQTFTGVRPITHVGTQDPITEIIASDIYHKGNLETLFPIVRDELNTLLQEYSSGNIRLERIDFRNITGVHTYRFELMNTDAIDTIAEENSDLFQIEESPSLCDWLIQNPEQWPMVSRSDDKTKDIRSGVLSGIPRSASELYANETDAPVDWKQTMNNIGKKPVGEILETTIQSSRLLTDEIQKISFESGLRFVHYDQSHIQWSKDARALLNAVVGIYGLPEVIKN